MPYLKILFHFTFLKIISIIILIFIYFQWISLKYRKYIYIEILLFKID